MDKEWEGVPAKYEVARMPVATGFFKKSLNGLFDPFIYLATGSSFLIDS